MAITPTYQNISTQYQNLKERQEEEKARKLEKLSKKHKLEDEVSLQFYSKNSNPDTGIYMPPGVYTEKIGQIDVKKYLKERGIKKYAKQYGIPAASLAIIFLAPPLLATTVPEGVVSVAARLAYRIWNIWGFYSNIFEWLWDPTVYHVPKLRINDDIVEQVFDINGAPILEPTSNRSRSTFFVIAGGIVCTITFGSYLVDVFHKYQNGQSIERILFEDYFTWQHTKINEIKIKYTIPKDKKRDEIIAAFKCSISRKPPAFPFRDSQGHLFEHANVMNLLNVQPVCPVNGHPLKAEELKFDTLTYEIIRRRIDELSS